MQLRTSLAGRYLGDWPFYREVIVVAMPIVLQHLIMTAMGFIDSVMVGQIDAGAMASVMVANKYFANLQCVLFGVNGALGIFIAQYYGAEDHDKGQGLFAINIMGSVAVAVMFLLLITAFPRAVLSIFVSDQSVVQNGQSYLQYVRFSYIPYAVSQACLTALRSIGHTRKPLLISSSAIILNTVLNYLLIFGKYNLPAMGVGGAGLATLIARTVEMVMYILLLGYGNQYFTLQLAPARKLGRKIIRQVFQKAIPLLTNEIFWSSGMTLLFLAYCKIDEANIASLTIVEATNNLSFVFLNGLNTAVFVLVGTRLGASRFAEARQNVRRLLSLSLFIAIFLGVVVFVLSDQLPMLFKVTGEIRQLTTQLLRVQAVAYGLILINVTLFFVLRTGGDMVATVAMDSAFVWLLVLPLALLLSLVVRPDLLIFYTIIQLTEIVKMAIAVFYYRKRRWLCNLT